MTDNKDFDSERSSIRALDSVASEGHRQRWTIHIDGHSVENCLAAAPSICRMPQVTQNVLVAVLICASVGVTRAQTPLSEAPVAGDLAPGVSHSFTVHAEAEDYLNILVEAQGIGIDAEVLFPNGSRMKRVSGPTTGMLPITFAAETAGSYTVRLAGRTSGTPTPSGRYSIRLTQRLSLQQRVSATQPPRRSAVIEALKRELAQTNSTDTSGF